MKNIVITILISIATLVIGLYIGAKYIGKAEVIATLCVMGEIALKENYLSKQELLVVVK